MFVEDTWRVCDPEQVLPVGRNVKCFLFLGTFKVTESSVTKGRYSAAANRNSLISSELYARRAANQETTFWLLNRGKFNNIAGLGAAEMRVPEAGPSRAADVGA